MFYADLYDPKTSILPPPPIKIAIPLNCNIVLHRQSKSGLQPKGDYDVIYLDAVVELILQVQIRTAAERRL